MGSGGRTFLVLLLLIALITAPPAAAETAESGSGCEVGNAEGSAVDRAATAKGQGSGKKSKKKKRPAKKKKITLQADSGSANKVVNLGDDREAEEVTLNVSVSPEVAKGFEKKLEVVAEPFANSSETGETVTFPEPEFSEPVLSGSGKRITFTMCVDPPNDLPAGKYTSTVRLEGPPPIEGAVMTITLNGKDGHGFVIAAIITALVSFFVLLYKGAAERRPLMLKAAEKKTGDERDKAIREAQGWIAPIKNCITDLGWLVPTVALLVTAFGLLYAVYAKNPAWGEGGLISSVIALVGTGLAAVGAKAVFTQSPPTR